jgi:hypothetical protein
MNRKFLISVVVLFIVSMVTDFIIHGALLGADYAKMAGTVFRTETDSLDAARACADRLRLCVDLSSGA